MRPPIDFPPFEPHPLLANGHLMTLASQLPRRGLGPLRDASERRVFRIDGETQVVAYTRWQSEPRRAPTLVLVHGLVGSADSSYVRGTAAKARAAGFNVLRLNVRNCGDTLHLTPTLYHSGLTTDLDSVVRELIERDRVERLVVAGFSLGGNLVLKWAAELGSDAPPELAGVAGVSSALDLPSCARSIDGVGANRIYRAWFLRSLGRAMRTKARLFPDLYDVRGIAAIRTMRAFDDRYTAPAGGFAGSDDYYERASALPLIEQVRVPALVVHAKDDPLAPFEPLARLSTASGHVQLLASEHGGHCGFVGRRPAPGDADRYWAESRVVQFARAAAEGRKATDLVHGGRGAN